MDGSTLLVLLALGTMLAVIAFALISKRKVEERREDDSVPKSTLAADAPNSR